MADRTPSADGQWSDQVGDRIESVVGAIRDKTMVPATKIARVIVFGAVAAALGLVALVFLVVAIIRLHVYLPYHPEGRRVWTTYVGLGAIFLLVGVFLWRKRSPRPR
jgi:hypothetical protein